MHPDTPVMVEWYSHRWIPSKHHAVIVPYLKALEWYNCGAKMVAYTIDTDLFEELFHERRPKADRAGR
jgi:hypothetical protein